MPNLQGQVLKGRYRIDELIGRGGMAEVYKAWDLRRRYHVAVKVMREDLAEDIEFLNRFKREAGALAILSHANVIRFYSFEREGRLAFIVMDYVAGTTLRGRILDAGGKPLPLAEVAWVMEQTCAALHYAHSQNVLHRDVKPGNIMIDRQGRVLVADFGIAKAADAATATTVMPGTPAYMSPEQCRSELLDARTDVYSLGIVAYEMLAGRRPFRGDGVDARTGSTREKIRWEQMHAMPPSLRHFNPGLPPQVEAVVMKALAKDRKDRWPTALAFWRALAQALSAAGTEARQRQAPPVTASPSHAATRPAAPAPSPAFPVGARPRQSAVPPRGGTPQPQSVAGRVRKGWLFGGAAVLVVILVVLVLAMNGRGNGAEVPLLLGQDLDSARAMLAGAGFEVVAAGAEGHPAAELVVWRQDPPEGEGLPLGGAVYLEVGTATPGASPSVPPLPPASDTPTPKPSSTAPPPLTATPTPTATSIPTQSPTSTLVPTATPTQTPTAPPTKTNTPPPTKAPTRTPTATPPACAMQPGWPFDAMGNAPKLGCPVTGSDSTKYSHQYFEGGQMIFRGNLKRIYVLYYTDNTWEWFPDTYTEGEPWQLTVKDPPPGLQQPIKGFDRVWENNPHVLNRVGWATQGEVGLIGGNWQDFEGGTALWMDHAGYLTAYFLLFNDGTWQQR